MAIPLGTKSKFLDSVDNIENAVVVDLDTDKYVVIYTKGDGKIYAKVATVSDTTITYGSEQNIFTTASCSAISGCKIDTDKFIVSYYWTDGSNKRVSCRLCTVSTTTITTNSNYEADTGNTRNGTCCSALSTTAFVIGYGNLTTEQAYFKVGTISGTSISFGSESHNGNILGGSDKIDVRALSSSLIIVTGNKDQTYFGLCAGTISGTSISFGTSVYATLQNDYGRKRLCKISATSFCLGYNYLNTVDSKSTYRVIAGSISGTTISLGTARDVEAQATFYPAGNWSLVAKDETTLVTAWYEATSNAYGKVTTIAVSGTALTVASSTTFDDSGTYAVPAKYCGVAMIGTSKFVIDYQRGDLYSIIGTLTSAPTVITQDCDNIDKTQVRGNGNITATGGANATRRGFCYKVGASGDPTVADSTAYDDGDFGTGAFTKTITGLTPETTYRVRAYAINSVGTSYGSTVSVTTLEAVDQIAGILELEAQKVSQIAGIIFAEATKVAQIAGKSDMETEVKGTVAGLSTLETEKRATTAGIVIFEFPNARETVAGMSDLETEKKNTLAGLSLLEKESLSILAGILTFEIEDLETLAGTAFLENTSVRQIAGKSDLEGYKLDQVAAQSTFEGYQIETVGGISTFEDEGVNTLAGSSDLENISKHTIGGISSLDKRMLAYSWQRKAWHDGARYWRASYDWNNNRIIFEYTTDGITFTENENARITDANVSSDFSIKEGGGGAAIVYSNGTDILAREVSGTYPGTAWTWGTATTVTAGDATNKMIYVELSLMRTDRWQVIYTHHDTSAGTYYIETKETQTAAITNWINLTILSDTLNTNPNCFGVIERTAQNQNNAIAIWARGNTLEYKRKITGTWGSLVNITTSLKAGKENAFACDNYILNNEVFIVYIKIDNSLVGRKYTDADGMLAEDLLDDGTSGLNLYPAMAQHTGGSMFAVWIQGTRIYLVQRESDGTIIPKKIVTNGLDPEASWLNINENSGLGSIAAIWQEGEVLKTEPINYLRVGQIAGISEFEAIEKSTVAGKSTFETEKVDEVAGITDFEYIMEESVAGIIDYEGTKTSQVAGTSNFDSYWKFATVAALAILELIRVDSIAGITELETENKKTVAGSSLFEDTLEDTLSGIIDFEIETDDQIAGISELEKTKLDQVAGDVTYETTGVKSVAGVVIFERANIEKQVAGVVILEETKKSQVAGLAYIEAHKVNNVAGTSQLEAIKRTEVAGITELELEKKEVLAGIVGFEREKKNQISGIITLERIKNNSVAGFANFVIDEYPYSVDDDSKPYNKLK